MTEKSPPQESFTSKVSEYETDIKEEESDYTNVLTKYSQEEVMGMGKIYAQEHGLDEELFAQGAAVAQFPQRYQSFNFLDDEQKQALEKESKHRWRLSKKLYEVVAAGAVSAAVQGCDQVVINGATLFYPDAFGITLMKNGDLIQGLVNGAPYLCASCIACWMSDWCNQRVGRRWVIFWTCVISAVTCIWQGFVNNWWHLFIARFMLGFGVGIKSATVPPYAAECAPKQIRGSLVMLWQFFTAVGIMFGYVLCLAFYRVPDLWVTTGLNWRLMLGSAALPAFIVLVQVPFIPESPRWLMGKGRHKEAFESLQKLRSSNISAARDCFYQYILLKTEGSYKIPTWKRLIEMFTVRRNRNGALGAWIVMFMQQFCGINVIAYYSSSIFIAADFSEIDALLASWGFGMINFTFAIPAFFSIDRFGRRPLLLFAFPCMCVFLLIAGFGFLIDDMNGRLAMVTTGVYLFTAVYSSSEGPVPFTYSAEAFPLYIRDLGMSFATATCWFFNFMLAFTWPRLQNAFKPTGAFGFYAAWNLIGFFMVLWFLPETKGLTLEELDRVFAVSAFKRARYHTRAFWNGIERKVFRRNIEPLPPLYSEKEGEVEVLEKPQVEHLE